MSHLILKEQSQFLQALSLSKYIKKLHTISLPSNRYFIRGFFKHVFTLRVQCSYKYCAGYILTNGLFIIEGLKSSEASFEFFCIRTETEFLVLSVMLYIDVLYRVPVQQWISSPLLRQYTQDIYIYICSIYLMSGLIPLVFWMLKIILYSCLSINFFSSIILTTSCSICW